MKKASKKQTAINTEVSRVFRKKKKENGGKCFFCELREAVDPAHIIRRSYGEFETEEKNIVPACRACHNIFDDGSVQERNSLRNLDKALVVMKELDCQYYTRFIDKYLS